MCVVDGIPPNQFPDGEISDNAGNFEDDTPLMPQRKLSVQSIAPAENEDPNLEDAEQYGYEDAEPTVTCNGSAASPIKGGVDSLDTTKPYVFDKNRNPRGSSLKSVPLGSSSEHGTTSRSRTSPKRGVNRCASTSLYEVRIRGERFPVQRRRSIDFAKKVQIKNVEPVSELAELPELWLQPDEFAQMKMDRRTVVHKHKKGLADMTDEAETLRGLEKYVDKSIRLQKNRAWDTVLLEQDEQELSGCYNEQRIADLYKCTTSTSPEKAVARAEQDFKDVQDYLTSPRTKKLMLQRLPVDQRR